jgi:hypothetical protein
MWTITVVVESVDEVGTTEVLEACSLEVEVTEELEACSLEVEAPEDDATEDTSPVLEEE